MPPLPVRLKRIKRISFNVFLRLKELTNNCNVCDLITPRGYQKFSQFSDKIPKVIEQNYIGEYEPSNIICVYSSSEWRWRRVVEWDHYINDPIENIKGHMIT